MGFAKLTWGVKASFRGYVEASGGSIAARDGADREPEGEIAFPVKDAGDLALDADGRLTGSAQFAGEAFFEAHGGMLRVSLKEPAIEAGPDGAVLTIAETATRRTAVIKLDVGKLEVGADGSVTIPATTTIDGMMIIGDHYPPGTVMDPVRLVVG